MATTDKCVWNRASRPIGSTPPSRAGSQLSDNENSQANDSQRNGEPGRASDDRNHRHEDSPPKNRKHTAEDDEKDPEMLQRWLPVKGWAWNLKQGYIWLPEKTYADLLMETGVNFYVQEKD